VWLTPVGQALSEDEKFVNSYSHVDPIPTVQEQIAQQLARRHVISSEWD
jgi:hypothetical protein